MMTTATATQPSSASILSAIPNAPATKAGSKVPVVAIDAAMAANLKKINALRDALKDAEGHMKLLQAQVHPQAEQLRRALCVTEHKHTASISLAGCATWVCQKKYSDIPISEETRLRASFPTKYDEFFNSDVTFIVDEKKVSAEALQKMIADGAVTKKVVIKPTEVFHVARSTDADVGKLADEAGINPVSFLTFGK